MADLILPLRKEYFLQIKLGAKTEEFRLKTQYWCSRLQGKTFERVVLTLGYPSGGDMARRIVRPWCGMREATVLHPHFGPDPVDVFAIWVGVHDTTTCTDGKAVP